MSYGPECNDVMLDLLFIFENAIAISHGRLIEGVIVLSCCRQYFHLKRYVDHLAILVNLIKLVISYLDVLTVTRH